MNGNILLFYQGFMLNGNLLKRPGVFRDQHSRPHRNLLKQMDNFIVMHTYTAVRYKLTDRFFPVCPVNTVDPAVCPSRIKPNPSCTKRVLRSSAFNIFLSVIRIRPLLL